MNPGVSFRVAGTPAPQGSVSAFVVYPKDGSRPRAVITHGKKNSPGVKALTAWRAAVSDAATEALAGRPPFAGPVRVHLVLRLPRPTSRPRWRWLPWEKPDIDKLTRSTLDALTGVLYEDDARVVDLHVRKRYAAAGDEPSGFVRVVSLLDQEREDGITWAAGGPAPDTL